ncbi:MAG TPA: hypothetical protein VEP50_19160 [bacterium]|nr:hypothetical protein [bacterium]
MRHPLSLVVLGIAGRSPFAGVAWQTLHHLEGFRRLGCDVAYVEDTGAWPYDAERNAVTDDPSYTVAYLDRLMARCGLRERWAFRAASQGRRVYGLDERQLGRLFERADVLVNLSAATLLDDQHRRVPVRIYLETDPVRSQIEVAKGDAGAIGMIGTHTHHFTYAENLGAPDCSVPVERFAWHPTRPPVILDWWGSDTRPPDDAPFTTVANWSQSNDIEWQGEIYRWSKHVEFMKFIDLPRRVAALFELTLACGDAKVVRRLEAEGWRVRDALALSRDLGPYREYIRSSRGEFTVAKDQNIRLRSGWFSDRSACYLAAGRPVVTQDTGFGGVVPVGRGVFAFRTMEDIVDSIVRINADYQAHARAAREIAAEYFDAERLLGDILRRVGAS